MKRCVCLLSGGIDSATTAALARAEGWQLLALTVDYGQRHHKELDCARKVAAFLDVAEHVIMNVNLRAWGGSALTSDDMEVPTDAQGSSEVPITYVPARNLVFLSLAVSFAEARQAKRVYFGANSLDFSGYPDCRPEFVEAFGRAAALGTRAGTEKEPVEILAPLQQMTKAQIIARGLELGLDYALCWSCYQGHKQACGKCDACRIRLAAFAQLGKEDSIAYEKSK